MNKILYHEDWGDFDLICGSKITSVYGNAADKRNYYKNDTYDSNYQHYNKKIILKNKILNNYFKKIELLRKEKNNKKLFNLYQNINQDSINDWLLKYQFLEVTNCNRKIKWINQIYHELETISKNKSDLGRAIKRGLNIFK